MHRGADAKQDGPRMRAAGRPPGPADMQPCRRCGYTHRRRMIALMARWYALPAGVDCDGGYFYLCPRCYHRLFGNLPDPQ